MPLKRCMSKGKTGWKFGKSGKCYTGPSAKQKALQQMRAMIASGYNPKTGK